MKKGLEIRLYPSKEQRVLIDRTLGCSRFVYNHVLALKKELWEDYKSRWNVLCFSGVTTSYVPFCK
jgi:putative transposase